MDAIKKKYSGSRKMSPLLSASNNENSLVGKSDKHRSCAKSWNNRIEYKLTQQQLKWVGHVARID